MQHPRTARRQCQTALAVPVADRRARGNDARTPLPALVNPHARIARRDFKQPAIRPRQTTGRSRSGENGAELFDGGRSLPALPARPCHWCRTQDAGNLIFAQPKDVQTDKSKRRSVCHIAQLTDTVSLSRCNGAHGDVHDDVMAANSNAMTDPLLHTSGVRERDIQTHETLGTRLKRLRTARKWLQADVAERLNVAEVSVTRWETDAQVPRMPDIKRLADLYTVPPSWLHYGGPGGPQTIAVVGIVGAGQTIAAVDDGPIDEVAVPYGTPPEMLAVEVHGDSMEPNYSHGNILLYRGHPQNPDELIGQRVIVRTESGLVMVKRLRRGAELDTFDLDSTNAATIPSQRLVWVAKVEAVIHR
jgi:transcriptional regulator with XRE-family HTH domain